MTTKAQDNSRRPTNQTKTDQNRPDQDEKQDEREREREPQAMKGRKE